MRPLWNGLDAASASICGETGLHHDYALYLAMTRKQADAAPSSRAVSVPVLPPAPASTPESAQISRLSPAKTSETSERVENQAGNGVGLIMPLRSTVADSPQVLSGQSVTTDHSTGEVYVKAFAPGVLVGPKVLWHV